MSDNFFDVEAPVSKFIGVYKDEAEYRADKEAKNYSKLKDFVSDPLLVFRKKHIEGISDFKTSPEMEFGSLVDCLLTDPDNKDNKFMISSAPEPTPNNKNFVDCLIELITNTGKGVVEEDFYQRAYDMAGIKSPKFEGFIAKFVGSDAEIYFTEKLQAIGKITLSYEDFERAERVVNILKTRESSKKLIDMAEHTQFPIKFMYEGVLFRVLLDLVSIDHAEKKIYPIDLKSNSRENEDFLYSFFKLKYYIQQGPYFEGVKAWAAEVYPDYTVEPFQFLVADAAGFADPLLFEIHPPEGQDFMHTFTIGDKVYQSGVDIVKDMQWHIDNDVWGMRKKFINNKGKIKVQL